MMIFSLVAMTGLEKCCITSAYLQWLCHSGERPVARGPLVFSAVECNILLFQAVAAACGRNLLKNPCAKGNNMVLYLLFNSMVI